MKKKKKDDQRKTAHKSVVTRKYIIINCDKYTYNFWMTVSRFSLSAVQLHMGMWAMITCHRHSPLQKNKEIILQLTKKTGNIFKKKATDHAPTYVLCFKISDTFR